MRPIVLGFILFLLVPPALADDAVLAGYERAAAMQRWSVDSWVLNQTLQPRWINDTEFWYAQQNGVGDTYIRVDVATKGKAPAFDHAALAAALEAHGGEDAEFGADDLPIYGINIGDDAVSFGAFGKQWTFSYEDKELAESKTPPPAPNMLISPDGKRAVYSQEHNLWLMDFESGESRALTTDGEKYYAYGTVPDATGRPAIRPEAVWSPDSRYVFTTQTDDRKVLPYAVIDFAPADGSVRPKTIEYRTALPGDEHVTRFRMTVIDTETGTQTEMRYPALEATRMNDTPFGGNRAWWSADSSAVYFVDIERGEQRVSVAKGDIGNGRTRVVFEEVSDTYIELGSNVYMPTGIVPLPERNEFVWYSEKNGWAHLYLHDANTGKQKRALTHGDWLVRDVIGYDSDHEELLISLGERRDDVNPYDREIARVNLNNGRMKIVSSGDSDRFAYSAGDFSLLMLEFQGENIRSISALSPDGNYHVETRQRPDRPSETVVVDRQGRDVMTVEVANPVGVPADFNWPEPISMTAADGETEIRGVMFKPADFDPNKKYPVIDYIYGGPQVAHVPKAAFVLSPGFDGSATLAQLGFIVVIIDGRGTTERSRAFHEASRGAVETASSVADHVAGIKQLAERYSFIDIDRVGITGFSGGGYMTAIAMLKFADFYKVGVAGAGNFDQRLFWHSWGERYQGMLDGDNYLQQAALTHAVNLKGKMLFIHGMLDHGVHPGGLFQLTQALMNENKKFDLVLMPQAGHELPSYAMVRMWDYFVTHLAGKTPPADFSAESSGDLMKAEMKALMAEKAAAAGAAAELTK